MAKYELDSSSLECLVQLGTAAYPIMIGSELINHDDMLARFIHGSQVLVVSNDTIAALYLNAVLQQLKHKQLDVVVLPDGEVYKSLQSSQLIFDALVAGRHHRDTTIVALGGGVIGDLAGFVASTYQRGVALVHLPTSLLAQVDSAIGGKTAVNYHHYKNLVGSFYHPKAVLINTSYLISLPMREYRAGLGEVVKYAMLIGGDFLQALIVNLKDLSLDSGHAALAGLITDCCAYKASVVAADPHEESVRSLLNLGHTVAHALEAFSENNRYLHGEAVAIGLYCAALLSRQLGLLSQENLDIVDTLLQDSHLPRRIPADVPVDTLIDLMMMDKKVKNQKMRFILMRAPGDCYLSDAVCMKDVERMIVCAQEGEQ